MRMGEGQSHSCDVIVVGAGPAGATLAHELAHRNVDVLLLEKAKLPRYKACAGGVTFRAASLLPFDIGEVVENVIYGARLSYKQGQRKLKTYDEPLAYMVTRGKFDHLLTHMARQAGAIVEDQRRVEAVRSEDDFVTVKTSAGTLRARMLVGADGANSTVARSVGLMRNVDYNIGIDAQVRVDQRRLREWDGVIGLDYGDVRGGYGWLFPKSGHISAGAGGPIGRTKSLRPYLMRLLERQGFGGYEVGPIRGQRMPLRRKGAPIAKGRVLLLGDAAGLVDALTGEGIYYAIRSAQLAVPAVMRSLEGGAPVLHDYEEAVDGELMPELGMARALLRLSTWAPRLCFSLLSGYDRVWQDFCRVLRGEKTYAGLAGEAGPLQSVFRLLQR